MLPTLKGWGSGKGPSTSKCPLVGSSKVLHSQQSTILAAPHFLYEFLCAYSAHMLFFCWTVEIQSCCTIATSKSLCLSGKIHCCGWTGPGNWTENTLIRNSSRVLYPCSCRNMSLPGVGLEERGLCESLSSEWPVYQMVRPPTQRHSATAKSSTDISYHLVYSSNYAWTGLESRTIFWAEMNSVLQAADSFVALQWQ